MIVTVTACYECQAAFPEPRQGEEGSVSLCTSCWRKSPFGVLQIALGQHSINYGAAQAMDQAALNEAALSVASVMGLKRDGQLDDYEATTMIDNVIARELAEHYKALGLEPDPELVEFNADFERRFEADERRQARARARRQRRL